MIDEPRCAQEANAAHQYPAGKIVLMLEKFMRKALGLSGSFYKPDVLWWLVIILGVFLRLRQYFVNRSFWVDEASLALNIVNRALGSLTLLLDYDQGAPIGFLFIQKFLILAFGNSEYVLRLFPLLSGILAVYLICRLAREYFGKFGWVAVFLFSISGSMIYYSSELKQYSSDVAIALLLVYWALQCAKEGARTRDLVFLGGAGIFAVLVSHPSAFVLLAVGPLLFFEKIRQRAFFHVRWLIGIGFAWGGAFLLTYILSLRHLIGSENLQEYWRHGYSPLPPWEHLDWYKNVVASMLPQVTPSFLPVLFPNFRQEYLVMGCLILIFIGIVSLLLRDKKLTVLVVSPFLLAFVASAMHRYPMSDRFLFFWFPSLLLLLSEGLSLIHTIIAKFNPKAAHAVYGFMALIILWSPSIRAYENALHPFMGEDIKPILAYLRDNVHSSDIVYVHNGSVTPFMYYAPFYDFDAGEIFIASKSWNFKRFTVDVESFHGSGRIWFIFSHIVSCDCEGATRADRLRAHTLLLDKYGVQLDHFEAVNASVYLYDLSR